MTANPERAPEPFDRTLPSPIRRVLELRAAARDSVVVADAVSDVQRRMLVQTRVEDQILEAVTSGAAPALIVISGSAGGGKSAAISSLLKAVPDAFGAWIEDATHSESPREDQFERLRTFFKPFQDGSAAWPEKPSLIAMNTGMVIRFFARAAREAITSEIRFSELETVMKARLGLAGSDLETADHLPLWGAVLVINLDHRPTTGGVDSLFAAMLRAVAPERPQGILAGAPRCAECTVRTWCFVRTNAEIISANPGVSVLDAAVHRIALQRGRPLPPRLLWDLIADVVTGGESFTAQTPSSEDAGDPCDRIVEIASKGDPQIVFERLASNGAWVAPASRLGQHLLALDPSFVPDEDVHNLIAGAGIDPDEDVRHLLSNLAGGDRAALPVAFQAVTRGEIDRPYLARSIVRSAFLAGRISPRDQEEQLFRAALADYYSYSIGDRDSPLENLGRVRRQVSQAIVSAFGERVQLDAYFRVEALDPARRFAILAKADVDNPEVLGLVKDPILQANTPGASIVNYQPARIVFRLAGVRLEVDMELFRMLSKTAGGTVPSTADLERFFALRRAAEALGRSAASEHATSLLLANQESGQRYRVATTVDIRGDRAIRVEVVAG